jgi:hypothetical protein
MRLLVLVMVTVFFAGCGAVVGDACTVNTECGPGVCIQASYAPGGVCTLKCEPLTSACPAGSACVSRLIDFETAGCLRTCQKDADCRTGYSCRPDRDGLTSACIGVVGFP